MKDNQFEEQDEYEKFIKNGKLLLFFGIFLFFTGFAFLIWGAVAQKSGLAWFAPVGVCAFFGCGESEQNHSVHPWL